MTFGKAISTCFSKYATFTGRASVSEFWWWTLFNFIVSAILGGTFYGLLDDHGSFIAYIWSLAVLLPSLGVLFRRLHDTGRSGWWWLIGFVPLVGWIILIVFCCMPSQPGANKYGYPPVD